MYPEMSVQQITTRSGCDGLMLSGEAAVIVNGFGAVTFE
jgi:hypothetical protein